MSKELESLSVTELDKLLDELDSQRLALRERGRVIQDVKAKKLAKESLDHKLSRLKPHELKELHQRVKALPVEIGVQAVK